MKQTIWTGTCAAIVSLATAGILAQSTPQTSTAPQSAPSSSDQKVTVTGCLKAAPQMANNNTADAAGASSTGTTAGTSGTAGTTGTAGTSGSTASGATGTTAAGATGTAGAPVEPKFLLTSATATPADASGAGTPQTFRLIANPTALTEHVGKKLELTGTIDKNSTPDPKDPSAAAPALRVESGKIVAASCSE
jgi:hypothetical protein